MLSPWGCLVEVCRPYIHAVRCLLAVPQLRLSAAMNYCLTLPDLAEAGVRLRAAERLGQVHVDVQQVGGVRRRRRLQRLPQPPAQTICRNLHMMRPTLRHPRCQMAAAMAAASL